MKPKLKKHRRKKPNRIVDRELTRAYEKIPCICCVPGEQLGDTCGHHLTTKGRFGDDVVENLMPLCKAHHTEIHMGLTKMIQKYPTVLYWLEAAGRSDIIERSKRGDGLKANSL